MKATGIVRKIDDLGRIVIPKEIRRVMRIREGDPLEIYTGSEGEIIFKKYSPISELSGVANQCAETLAKTSGHPIVITDKDNVIAVSGAPKKEFVDRKVSAQIEKVMEDKISVTKSGNQREKISIVEGDQKYSAGVVCPIVSEGDSIGSVIILNKEDNETAKIGETEEKLAKTAAGFLAKQLEE